MRVGAKASGLFKSAELDRGRASRFRGYEISR
jgi:hypothetical protein